MLKGEVDINVNIKQQNLFKILSQNLTIQGLIGGREIFEPNELYMGPDDIVQGLEKKVAIAR